MRRRGLLTLGIVSAGVLAVGDSALALLQPGLRDGRLSERARQVFASVGRALLAGCLPDAQPHKARAADALLARLATVVSARVMGGCAAAASEQDGVVRPDGTHWQIANLSIHDGSIFPTSIGAYLQLSIYGIVNRLAQGLIRRLGGREVVLA